MANTHTSTLIAIPVFNAKGALERCLQSLISASINAPHRLLIINDASTDQHIAPLIDAFSYQHPDRAIEVRHNAINRGFTWNVNQALAAVRPREHVVLLNSDTIVTEGWLDEMLNSAATDAHIGTVTPFSNNATICSFPDFTKEWPVPSEAQQIALAKALAATPADAIEIPTAVGFCMLITHACLRAVGHFDAINFPRGYGEENDFCRRAIARGFRNVLCPNAFVAHEGSQSFSEEKYALMKQGGERLLQLHPDYNHAVAAWIAQDPVKTRRDAIASALMH